MLYTRCTVHDGTGGRCGVTDVCSLVRTMVGSADEGWEVLHEHRVCHAHRVEMGLPDRDVALTPGGMVDLVDGPTLAG